MSIITISRQLGSLGDEIAEIIAKQLNYQLVHRQIINDAARKVCAPSMALVEIDELGLLNVKPSAKECQEYLGSVREIVQNLAQKNNMVLLGRAGQIILQESNNTLHVRIYAPEKIRAERVKQKQHISIEAAKAQIEASDQSRRKYLKRFYNVKLSDPDLYDIAINTANYTAEAAAEIILLALRRKTSQ